MSKNKMDEAKASYERESEAARKNYLYVSLAIQNDDLLNELAAQRRTIATLRARLQNRKGGYWSRGKQPKHWLYGWRNRYDALRAGYINLSPACDGYSSREAKARHRQRIAAIRNFGGLPGDAPSMPGYFYDGAWHAKPADGYKGRATFDAGLNDWTWWVVGFAGYVRAESYYEARARAEASLRNIGALS